MSVPSNVRMMGVSKSLAEREINHLTDAEQDEVIKMVAKALEADLVEFVGHARPRGELIFQVEGPHDDPLQGRIHIHTLAAMFAIDDLPDACAAYRVHVQGNPDTTPGPDFTTDGSDR